jgi:hypothetical protein
MDEQIPMDENSLNLHRFIFDIFTGFLLLIIMLELVGGIIIDAFGEMR